MYNGVVVDIQGYLESRIMSQMKSRVVSSLLTVISGDKGEETVLRSRVTGKLTERVDHNVIEEIDRNDNVVKILQKLLSCAIITFSF